MVSPPSKTLRSPSASSIHDDADSKFEDEGNSLRQTVSAIAFHAGIVVAVVVGTTTSSNDDAPAFDSSSADDDDDDDDDGPQEHLAIHRVAPYQTSSRS